MLGNSYLYKTKSHLHIYGGVLLTRVSSRKINRNTLLSIVKILARYLRSCQEQRGIHLKKFNFQKCFKNVLLVRADLEQDRKLDVFLELGTSINERVSPLNKVWLFLSEQKRQIDFGCIERSFQKSHCLERKEKGAWASPLSSCFPKSWSFWANFGELRPFVEERLRFEKEIQWVMQGHCLLSVVMQTCKDFLSKTAEKEEHWLEKMLFSVVNFLAIGSCCWIGDLGSKKNTVWQRRRGWKLFVLCVRIQNRQGCLQTC